MRVILLKGHERPITDIQYNRDGDLLFSCAKDKLITAWYTDNGERLGTYNGHKGAVQCLDVNWTTTRLLTASMDMSVKLWDVQTGRELCEWAQPVPMRSCAFAMGDRQFLCVGDNVFGHPPTISVYQIPEALLSTSRPATSVKPNMTPVLEIVGADKNRFNRAEWGPLNESIIACCEDGSIIKYDAQTGKQLAISRDHSKSVQHITFNKEKTMFISASSDYSAKLFDTKTLTCHKTYMTDKPVNAAAISPTRNHVVLGGGQEASMVTTTAMQSGKFESRFFHLVFEEEIGTVKGHFGPINAIAFAPDGKGFATGGEDGFVRLHHFDNEYLNLKDTI